MAEKNEMIYLELFAGNIFRSVKRIFILFNEKKMDGVNKELKKLLKFVELNYDDVCNWGYECSYVPYRTVSAAMKKDVLREIIEVSDKVINNSCDGMEELSQNLWRLIDGWNRGFMLELFLCRAEMKFEARFQ